MSPRVAPLALALLALSTATRLASAGLPDMGSLWPNTDGLAWSYAQRSEDLSDTPSTTDRVVRLLFDGTAVAPTGIDVQVLHGELLSGPPATSAQPAAVRDPFLRSLLRARPELRAAVEASIALAPCPANAAPGLDAILLGGDFAYRKSISEIAAWRCNLANTRAWLWLVSNLSPGHQFQLQLVPDLASDVFLHGTIGAVEPVAVPAGAFPFCQRVDYLVDYGLGSCTDENGTPLGTYRSVTRGAVWYVAGVGPVKSTEEFIPFDEVNGTCVPRTPVGQPSFRVTMQLTALPVPVAASSWGQVKTRYR